MLTDRKFAHFGEVYWSPHFQDRIVVVDYIHDNLWWFVKHGTHVVQRAQTPLSEMGIDTQGVSDSDD